MFGSFAKEKNIRLLFQISLVLKGLFAVLEIVGGIAAFFVTKELLLSVAAELAESELAEGPGDIVANYFLQAAQNFSVSTQHFAAAYLLSHGIIKFAVIMGLLKRIVWVYPTALVVFGLFIAYQLYRFTFTHSVWLIVLTVLDLFVIALTWHEYRYLRHHRAEIR